MEAHGTGTTLGDPIEAQALLATYGQSRRTPLWLGSVKSNLGHTQAAAGVAGVIKMVQAMRHGVLPQDVACGRAVVACGLVGGRGGAADRDAAVAGDRVPRRAAVSSFGVSGTNAHVVLEQAPDEVVEPADGTAPSVLPVMVSGRSAAGLRAQAERLLSVVDEHDVVDLARSLATTRAALDHRAAVLAGDRDTLCAGLRAVAAGTDVPSVVTGVRSAGQLAFLFTGQGAQRAGMGLALRAFPVFQAAFDELVAALGLDLAVFSDAQALGRTDITQPALFAVEVALYRLVEFWGLRPDYLAGHSIGELAAAHVAGVLSLQDACALVTARGRLMRRCRRAGPCWPSRPRSPNCDLGRVDLAAVNGPGSLVVSGDEDAVAELEARWRAEGRKVKRLVVSHAFHSYRMDPMLDEFARVAKQLTFREPEIPLVSTVSGDLVPVDNPEYWVRQVREPVRFADAMGFLHEQGVTRFLELGPDGVLTAQVPHGVALATQRSGRDDVETVLRALASADVHGVDVNWDKVFDGWGRRVEPAHLRLPAQHLLAGHRAGDARLALPGGVDAGHHARPAGPHRVLAGRHPSRARRPGSCVRGRDRPVRRLSGGGHRYRPR